MIEINLNFVLFQELQEKPDSDGAVTRIVIVRGSKDPNLALEEGATDSHLLE
jgi:hypothetical protein